MRSRRLEPILCLLLIAVTLSVFWQVRYHDFVDYDDPGYVTDNYLVRSGLTREGVAWAFADPRGGNWIPLTWLSHMLDCQNHGLNAGGHHTTSLLFHLLNTFLLFVVLRLMTGCLWRSVFVAALFALHPLHVESVAWVAERKDVLSTLFWMLTLWAYFRYAVYHKKGAYGAALVFFVLGLTAKPMLVTVPFVLLLLDFWPLGRLKFGRSDFAFNTQSDTSLYPGNEKPGLSRLVLEKLPFFALAAIFSAITFYAQRNAGAVATLAEYGWKIRISNALVSYVSYIGKMIWPLKLSVLYPLYSSLPIWQVLGSGLILGCISFLVIRAYNKYPYLLVGWLWYLGTLVPVIGLVQVGSQSMADRYTYVPLIGLFVMVAWGTADLMGDWRHRRVAAGISSGIILTGLIICTWLQLSHWKNGVTLFEHAVSVTTKNNVAHNMLGYSLEKRGNKEEAFLHYSKALRINPNHATAHINVGRTLERKGRLKEAVRHYSEAIRIKPDLAEAYVFLGLTFKRQGNTKEAIRHYSKALRINYDFEEAHNNLGVVLEQQGRLKEAISHYQEALRIKPDFLMALNNLGNALARQGRLKEAIKHHFEALRINPRFAEAHNSLGVALMRLGNFEEASRFFSDAIRIKPDFAEAHNSLGVALMRQKRLKKALKHFHEALRINPGYTHAHNNLNRCLRLLGRSPKAAPKPTGTSQHISVQCRKKWELKRAGARERPPKGVADI